MQRVVVVGAGIAGLTAAYDLIRAAPDTEVVVLEAAVRIGGKLLVREVAGVPVDVGAEAALARVPDVLDLLAELGLAAEVVHPGTTAASIAVAGARHPVPTGTLLGIPADLAALRASGLLSADGVAAVAADPERPGPPVTVDLSVASLVRERLGGELLDRLVEPLLGGVYAGRAERLSVQATMPALWSQLAGTGSLVEAARAAKRVARSESGAADGPVVATLPGGLGRLPAVLAGTAGVTVRTGLPVRTISRTADGFRVVAGPVPEPTVLDCDAVVVAVPPGKAASLLRDVAPMAAADLAGIATASMAIVTLAVPAQAFPAGSGLLVGSAPGAPAGAVKAVTLSSQKWAHLGGGELAFVRASIGRRGEEAVLQRDDDELVALVRTELGSLIGLTGRPVDATVTRWGGGLPQYDVGHTERVARIRAAVSAVPGLAVCGAAYDGVGIAACIRGARHAAHAIRVNGPAAMRGQWRDGRRQAGT